MSNTNLFDLGPNHAPMQTNSKRLHAPKLLAGVGPKTGRSQLEVDFQPSDHSVICGRGRQHNHIGNRRFRLLASVFVESYSRAYCKTAKAALVFDIITMIRQAGGQFCKYEDGAWFEVGDRCARGKVSAYFRDMLHTQYRSSAKAKTMRRSSVNRRKARIPKDGQQVVDGTGEQSVDASISSSRSEISTDSLGSETSLEIDCSDMDVFNSSTSPPFSGSSTDSLGFDMSQEIDFFDIEVF
jgi:hypothetical protein